MHLQHLLVPLLDECHYKSPAYEAINYQLFLIILKVPLLLRIVFRGVLETVELELSVVLIREGYLGFVVSAHINYLSLIHLDELRTLR